MTDKREIPWARKRIVVALAMVSSVMGSSGLASAQEQARLEEVIVTASRREATVQDIPYNISAISGDALTRAGVTDFKGLTQLVPGVSYVDTGNRNAGNVSSFILRGVNADAATANADFATTRAPTVSVYVNETPMFFEMSLVDIERVEVLRGPQGTLYGSGAVGGTIRILTTPPRLDETTLRTEVKLSSTEDGEPSYAANGTFNTPLGNSAALRVSANVERRGGFIDSPNRYATDNNGGALPADPSNPINSAPLLDPKSDINGADSASVRAALKVELTDNVSAVATYHYQDDEGDGRQAIHPSLGDENDLFNVAEEPFSREAQLASLELDVDFGFATMTSATSYYEIDTEVTSDFSDQVGTYYAPYYYGGTYPRLMAVEDDEFSDEAFIQELRLASSSDNTLDWVVGAFYQKLEHTTDSVFLLPGVADYNALPGNTQPLINYYTGQPLDSDITFVQLEEFETEEMALFAELTWHVTDRWQITGGARTFKTEFEVESVDAYLGFPSGRSGSFDDDDSIFKLNTSFDIADDMMAYATWAEGYRRGGANSLANFDPISFATFEPDTAENVEAGIKGQFLDGNVQYTAAAFQIEWDNVQITSYTDFGTAVVINGSGAENRGAEFELTGAITDRLLLSGGYTYVEAKTTGSFVGGDGFVPDGERLPAVPEHMATVSLNYSQPLNDLFGGSHLVYNLGGFYRSAADATFETNPDNFEMDSFSLWNASLSLQTTHWNSTLFVDNLSNEEGITGGIGEQLGFTGQYRYRTRPRTIGISVSYNM